MENCVSNKDSVIGSNSSEPLFLLVTRPYSLKYPFGSATVNRLGLSLRVAYRGSLRPRLNGHSNGRGRGSLVLGSKALTQSESTRRMKGVARARTRWAIGQ